MAKLRISLYAYPSGSEYSFSGEEKSFPYGCAESLHWRSRSQLWAGALLCFCFERSKEYQAFPVVTPAGMAERGWQRTHHITDGTLGSPLLCCLQWHGFLKKWILIRPEGWPQEKEKEKKPERGMYAIYSLSRKSVLNWSLRSVYQHSAGCYCEP